MSDNADIIVCIGDGTKGSGCGEAGGRSGDACSRCGGMLLSKIALKAADELAAMRQEEPSHTDCVSEESFTVHMPGRGEVVVPLRWTRTHRPSGFVHEVSSTLVHDELTVLEEVAVRIRHVKFETRDSTSEDPCRPTVTEIVTSLEPSGAAEITVTVGTGPRDFERTQFSRTGTGPEERQLVRQVVRGAFEHTWTYFDEPQPDRSMCVRSHGWRQVDGDGKEVMKCEEVADGLVLHPPKFGVAKAGGDVGKSPNAKGKAARQAPGLRVDLLPDEGKARKGKRAGKKDGRRAAGRVRKGRGGGDRVRA